MLEVTGQGVGLNATDILNEMLMTIEATPQNANTTAVPGP